MDLDKLFGDELLVEIMGFADVSWTREDDRISIWVRLHDEIEVTKTQMEVVIDFFAGYQINLNLIGDPVFVIEDYPIVPKVGEKIDA